MLQCANPVYQNPLQLITPPIKRSLPNPFLVGLDTCVRTRPSPYLCGSTHAHTHAHTLQAADLLLCCMPLCLAPCARGICGMVACTQLCNSHLSDFYLQYSSRRQCTKPLITTLRSDLGRAPYVLYGVNCIDLVSLMAHHARFLQCRCFVHWHHTSCLRGPVFYVCVLLFLFLLCAPR